MHDPRIDQLARQLVRHSTRLKRGEKVLLDLYDVPEAVGVALIREARARGAVPFLRLNSGRLVREMWKGATDEQYKAIAKHLMAEMREMDAYIAFLKSDPAQTLYRAIRDQNQQMMPALMREFGSAVMKKMGLSEL